MSDGGQRAVAEHVKAKAEAWKWAEKAIKLEEAGKKREAAAAKKQATKWLKAQMDIEAAMKPVRRF